MLAEVTEVSEGASSEASSGVALLGERSGAVSNEPSELEAEEGREREEKREEERRQRASGKATWTWTWCEGCVSTEETEKSGGEGTWTYKVRRVARRRGMEACVTQKRTLSPVPP